MSEETNYRLGPDVSDDEELCDSRGRVVDDDYIETAIDEALEQVRRRGLPSPSGGGES
jgi:hypothetical protein